MKDIKFFLRKKTKSLGGFNDYKKDTYKLFAIIPKDKYSINYQNNQGVLNYKSTPCL